MSRMDDQLEQRRQHREYLLDQALMETFPAASTFDSRQESWIPEKHG